MEPQNRVLGFWIGAHFTPKGLTAAVVRANSFLRNFATNCLYRPTKQIVWWYGKIKTMIFFQLNHRGILLERFKEYTVQSMDEKILVSCPGIEPVIFVLRIGPF